MYKYLIKYGPKPWQVTIPDISNMSDKEASEARMEDFEASGLFEFMKGNYRVGKENKVLLLKLAEFYSVEWCQALDAIFKCVEEGSNVEFNRTLHKVSEEKSSWRIHIAKGYLYEARRRTKLGERDVARMISVGCVIFNDNILSKKLALQHKDDMFGIYMKSLGYME